MMKKRQTLTLLFIHFAFTLSYITAQTTTLVAVGTNGKLVYTADAKGNVIPDFSGLGYMNSEAVVPTVAVVKIVTAISGDNRANELN